MCFTTISLSVCKECHIDTFHGFLQQRLTLFFKNLALNSSERENNIEIEILSIAVIMTQGYSKLTENTEISRKKKILPCKRMREVGGRGIEAGVRPKAVQSCQLNEGVTEALEFNLKHLKRGRNGISWQV